jgi:hypothetical protein
MARIPNKEFDAQDVTRWWATAEAADRHGVIRRDRAGRFVLWGRQHDLAGCELWPVARLSDAGLAKARELQMSELDI